MKSYRDRLKDFLTKPQNQIYEESSKEEKRVIDIFRAVVFSIMISMFIYAIIFNIKKNYFP